MVNHGSFHLISYKYATPPPGHSIRGRADLWWTTARAMDAGQGSKSGTDWENAEGVPNREDMINPITVNYISWLIISWIRNGFGWLIISNQSYIYMYIYIYIMMIRNGW